MDSEGLNKKKPYFDNVVFLQNDIFRGDLMRFGIWIAKLSAPPVQTHALSRILWISVHLFIWVVFGCLSKLWVVWKFCNQPDSEL